VLDYAFHCTKSLKIKPINLKLHSNLQFLFISLSENQKFISYQMYQLIAAINRFNNR
jgi:hypothetical protein